jgi:hypothetical protein
LQALVRLGTDPDAGTAALLGSVTGGAVVLALVGMLVGFAVDRLS